MENEEKQFKLVVDTEQRRPMCVLLQAVFGGDRNIVNLLPAEAWLVAPTDNMKMVAGTKAQWEKFAQELKERFPARPRTPRKNRG